MWIDIWIDLCIYRYMEICMYILIHGNMYVYIDIWIDLCIYRYMEIWIYGYMAKH